MADEDTQIEEQSEPVVPDKSEDQSVSPDSIGVSEPENMKDTGSADDAGSPISSGTPAPTKNKGSKPVSGNLEKLIEQIEKLSVLELAELVHALEDKFGVSATAPVAVAGPVAAVSAGEPAEEQTSFNVILTASGANKIAVIKAVRELVPTLGLKEAKDLVEAAPKPVMEGVNKETANTAKEKLTTAGGTVELQ